MELKTMEIKKGSIVKIEYTGTLDDGKVFDCSDGRDPLEFEVGAGKVIKGFEDGVMGMKDQEEKTIKIKAKDAYGERNELMVQPIPKDKINIGREVTQGMILGIQSPDGQQVPVVVAKVDAENVYLDMNHPLAGKNLNFKVKVVSIKNK
jgi:FKBP-type peptidyl-prolyl cis-trans isomerase 2